jgi:hypothetical protein
MKNITLPKFEKNFEIIYYVCFFSILAFWLGYRLSFYPDNFFLGDFFGLILIIFPLMGNIFSYIRTIEWGFTKSQVGTSIFFFSLSISMWIVGQTFYFLNNSELFTNEIFDFFFITMDPLNLLALLFLGQSLGTFKEVKNNLSILLLPVLLTILNYIAVSTIQNKDVFTSFLKLDIDFIFIFGSLITASLIVTLILFSRKLGGVYKNSLKFILIGIIFQYIGDNIYELTQIQENGAWYDMFFFVSLFFITYGIYSLNPRRLNER